MTNGKTLHNTDTKVKTGCQSCWQSCYEFLFNYTKEIS